ncbi:MAG: DNA polymerase III subunit delta [Gemmatimonadales bacterium]|nr:DNA polymerase III subunit delta [Gemmatimonadales bacterium]
MPALDFDALLRSLKKGEIRPAYYFHGAEDLLKDDALRGLLATGLDPSTLDFNLDRRRASDTSAEDFHALAQTPPMLAARRAVVLTEVESLQQRRPKAQALHAALTTYLRRPSPETLLILVQSSGEKNKPDPAFAKLATSVAFDPLKPERVGRWIRHRAGAEGLMLDDHAAEHLQAAVGDDLAQLAAELAKLKAAVGDRTATMDDVADLVGVRHGETAHDLVDAVTRRRFADAARMIPFLLNGPGVTGVRLVTALGVALNGVALARACLDAGAAPGAARQRLESAIEAARPANLRGYDNEASRWAEDAAGWRADDLQAALTALLGADRRLKATSLGGEAEVVTDAVLAMGARAQVAA